jgi:hypothetical protein
MVAMLHKMREVGQPLATSTSQPILRGMIGFLAPYMFSNNKHGGFKVIQEWTHQFMKHYMNQTFKVSTTATNKFPLN